MDFGLYNWRRPAFFTSPTRWDLNGYSYRESGPMPCDSRGMSNYIYNQNRRNNRPQCFNCRRFGHVAKNCHVQNHISYKKTTRKSERKLDRDRRRYVQFKNRRNVCALMPFSDISDSELLAFIPKFNNASAAAKVIKTSVVVSNLHCATQEISELKIERSTLVECNNRQKEEILSLERIIGKKDSDIEQLSVVNNGQHKQILILENTIQEAKYEHCKL